MGGGLWVGRFAQGGVLTSELFTVSRPQLPAWGGPCGVTKAQCQGLQYRRESCGWSRGVAGEAEQLCGWVSSGSNGLGAGPGGEEGASVRPARPC